MNLIICGIIKIKNVELSLTVERFVDKYQEIEDTFRVSRFIKEYIQNGTTVCGLVFIAFAIVVLWRLGTRLGGYKNVGRASIWTLLSSNLLAFDPLAPLITLIVGCV
jgi:hypothetical protein